MKASPAQPPQYEQLADKLRRQIMSGELPAGARLPAEQDLLERYGVSRSTWREALRTLSAEKLVVATRGVTGGTFVAEPSPSDLEDYVRNSLQMLMRNHLTPEQILEARYLLEVPAAALAAERRTPAQLDSLRESIAELREGDAKGTWNANNRFHVTLLEATGNPLLRALISPINAALRSNILREHARAEFWDQVSCDHEDILEAVERGDREGAERAMRQHLANLRVTYVELSAEPSPPPSQV